MPQEKYRLGENSVAYKVERFAATRFPLEANPKRTKVSLVTTWTLWSIYMLLQSLFALSLQHGTDSFLWQLWIVIFAEFCLSFQELVYALSLVLTLFGAPDKPPRPSLRLVGELAPTVAVLVTCCGEPVDIIINTVFAAAVQDYPSGRHNVFVLDDGHDEMLREKVKTLNETTAKLGGANVVYLSRTIQPGTKSYFKAGNLQFGIQETQQRGNSDLLAGLDADMIPHKSWLRNMVPHLVGDEKTAMAVLPQDYYNVPDGDPLGQCTDFSMYFTIQEPLNDRLDTSMCTGTGYAVKRKALKSIGGWPLAGIAEDFMCSSMLNDAGWKVAFVREKLQSGLAPESLQGLIEQRMRWTDGGIGVHQHFNFYLPGSKTISHMTPGQRAVGILYTLRDYAPLTNVAALFLLPIALFSTNANKITSTTSKQQHQKSLAWLQAIHFLFYIAQKVNFYIVYHHIGLAQVLNFKNMAVRCIASCLPTQYNPATFTVCGTVISGANERSHLRRRPLLLRLMSPDMLIDTLYITYALIPLLSVRFPFPGVLVTLVRSISNTSVPLRYMIWPPTVPEWADLIVEDECGVKRPRKVSVSTIPNGLGKTPFTREVRYVRTYGILGG